MNQASGVASCGGPFSFQPRKTMMFPRSWCWHFVFRGLVIPYGYKGQQSTGSNREERRDDEPVGGQLTIGGKGHRHTSRAQEEAQKARPCSVGDVL